MKNKKYKLYKENLYKGLNRVLLATNALTLFLLTAPSTKAAAPIVEEQQVEYAEDEELFTTDGLINMIKGNHITRYQPEMLSKTELENAEEVEINVYSSTNNFELLYHMKNLKKLKINDYDSSNKALKNLDGKKLPNDMTIILKHGEKTLEPETGPSYDFTGINNVFSDEYSFLRDIKNIKNLYFQSFYDFSTDDFLVYLQTVENLTIFINGENYLSVDFEYLENLKCLTLVVQPYNFNINFTPEQLEKLNNSSFEFHIVDYSYQDVYDKVLEISRNLQKIYNDLGILPDDDDLTKLDKIVDYVLRHTEYSPIVEEQLLKGEKSLIDHKPFYSEGYLYGTFENDDQICGNYAALTNSLCLIADVESYFISSINHAWNLVILDGEPYYVDTTWMDEITITNEDGSTISLEEIFLDEEFESERHSVDGYLVKPDELTDITHTPEDYPHIYDIAPKHIDTTYSIPTTALNITSNSIYTINYKDKVYKVSGSVIMGLLIGLGVAKKANIKKKEENKRINY